jgi:hypothetical protein
MSFSKIPLSGSTDFRPVVVAASASPGTLIHTASSSAGTVDEVWIFAANISGSAVSLTVEWGGTGTGDRIIAGASIPANSFLYPVVTGIPLQNGLIVRAFAGTANVINITGYGNRITP